MTLLVLTVSGSFRSNGKVIDYSDLKIEMPECEQGWVQSHAMNRIFPMAAEEQLGQRVDSLVTMYIDGQEKIEKKKVGDKQVDAKPLCCGKKIKSLNWEEIEHFAIMYNLIAVPLAKTTDLRTAREIAYREYMAHIKGNETDKFDYAAAPDMTIADVAEKTAKVKSNAKEVLEGSDLIGEEKKKDNDQ